MGKSWAELPAASEGSNLLTHCMYVSNSTRNYTMLYDKSEFTAYWVAYPIVTSYLGQGYSGGWTANPEIDSRDQINIWTSSYGVNLGSTTSDGYNSSAEFYARGHQIPNADRSGNSQMQAQTYYAPNSTPQIQNRFNASIWASLEKGVREESARTDTLYVVTGATLRTAGGNETVTYITPKSDVRQCPVPNYYYKVVLKCRRSTSGEITAASMIGFWLKHDPYDNGSAWSDYTQSVAQIEALTGFEFFVNVPESIRTQAKQNSSWSAFQAF